MVRRLACVLFSLGLIACARSEAPTVTPVGAATPGTAAPAAAPAPTPKKVATKKRRPPTPRPPRATPKGPRSAPAAAKNTLSKMKELERNPGATPPPPTVIVPAGPKHKSLEGKPGPSPAFGPNDAPVKVFLYSDFQCPVCRRVVEPIKTAVREMEGRVQIVFKHNALTMHPRAEAASKAAMAAFLQGKFWEYHDLLFQDQRALGDEDFLRHARALDLDMAKFNADMQSAEVAEQIAYERATAAALDARGTPGFFINGKKQVGWGSYGSLKAMVARAAKAAEVVAAKGTPAKDVAKKATQDNGEDGAKLAELLWGTK